MGAFKDWYESIWGTQGAIQSANQTMPAFTTQESLDNYYNSLPDKVKNDTSVQAAYQAHAAKVKDIHVTLEDPIKKLLIDMLDSWTKKVAQYDMKDPAKAKETLAGLTAQILEISGGAFALELGLGAVPFVNEGPVSQARISELMGWLGFGAVVNAVAHDPVKIGLLRPYQDSLEATFRNRRPGDQALFQAYRTRELTPTKADPEKDIPDKLLSQIEDENQGYYDREIAKWGYSEWFAGALARSATRTPTFGNLTVLARQGILTRGMAIYSLWGYGMDKLTMKPSLDALMKLNDQANYGGFRSMIEPSYIEGDISDVDLRAYYDKIGVPKDVQDWIMPRLIKKRQAYLFKQAGGKVFKEQDLTVSQLQLAYQDGLLDRAHAQNEILTIGYSLDEVKILLDIADMRRRQHIPGNLKRLPLSDYEKAFKNKLISQDAVLARMKGEYTQEDIALEKQLLLKGVA